MLILTERDVASMLSMEEGVRLVEESFREYGAGRATLAPRVALPIGGEAGVFRTMAASVPASGVFGLKTLTGVPGRRRAGATYFAMLLFDVASGALAAMLPATHITGIRTGAAGGVAARHLAREDARAVGLIGAGFQGRAQVAAIRVVRPIEHVRIFDINRELAARYALELRASGIDAEVVDAVRPCVAGCDIVVSATTSTHPVILGEWLQPGVHVNAIGANAPSKRELDPAAFTRGPVVADFAEQVLTEAGDLIDALRAGAVAEADVRSELGHIVAGLAPGRQRSQEITIFKSVGVAFQDVAVAGWVYAEAVRRGMGVQVEVEESTHETV
jgi:alanine dehydrogenase